MSMRDSITGKCEMCFLMGVTWFRQGEIAEKAAGKATDLIRANNLNANEDVYAVRLAA